MMQKFRVELVVPSDVDPSEILERVQELACALCEEFAPTDDSGEECEPDEDAVSNEVSVEATPIYSKFKGFYPGI